MDQELICAIADEIIRQLTASGQLCPAPRPQEDPASPEGKASALLDPVSDPDALARMMRSTTARIGVGRCGPRLKTRTLLALRADHAQARDSAFADVDPQVLEQAGLFTVQSRCPDKTTFLTRPNARLLVTETQAMELLAQGGPVQLPAGFILTPSARDVFARAGVWPTTGETRQGGNAL